MPKFTMLSGPSGSGKSTVARTMMQADPNLVRINRDDIRAMSIHGWKSSKEEWIIEGEKALARTACRLKKNVVIDDTNLTDSDRARWSGIAQEFPTYQFQTQVINPGLEVCLQRDSLRTGSTRVGRVVIERQFLRGKLIDWTDHEVAIFDIDGTLADLEHRIPWITIGASCPNCSLAGRPDYAPRGYAELPDGFDEWINGNWTCKYCDNPGGDVVPEDVRKLKRKYHDMFYNLCDYDNPIDIVIKWAQTWYDNDVNKKRLLLIVSGRSPENQTSEKTIRWLSRNRVPLDHIYMRRAWCHGPDTEEKQLILNDLLASGLKKEQIKFVVDDRPSVVQMWRDNGLRVIPVRGRDDDQFYTSSKESKEIVCH